MSHNIRSSFHADNLIFASIQWFFWSGYGLLIVFLTAYYQNIGFSNTTIGLVVALMSLTNILGQLALGITVDHVGSTGRILRASLMAGILCLLAIFILPETLAIIALLSALISFTLQALPPIIDGWTMAAKQKGSLVDYGKTRAMGSMGFSLTVLFSGQLFNHWKLEYMFPLAAILLTVVILLVTRGKKLDGVPAPRQKTSIPTRTSLHRFFTPGTILLLILYFLTFTAFRPVHVFLPIYMRSLGGTNAQIGYAFALMGLSEVPIMLLFSWLMKRFRDSHLLFVSFIFFFIRIFVHIFAPDPQFLIAVQVLQGLSFGLYWPASVHLLDRISPKGAKTFAQTMGTVVTFGLGGIAGGALGGYLIDSLGIVKMYVIMSALMAGVCITYGIAIIKPGKLSFR